MNTQSFLQIVRAVADSVPRTNPFCWWMLSFLVAILGIAFIILEAVTGAVVERQD